MADSGYKRSGRRPDGERAQQWDDRDRRNRGRGGREREDRERTWDNRDRDGARDRGDGDRDWERSRRGDRGDRSRGSYRARDSEADRDRIRDHNDRNDRNDRDRRYRSRSRDRRDRRRSRSRSPGRGGDSNGYRDRDDGWPRKAAGREQPRDRDDAHHDDNSAHGANRSNTDLPSRPRPAEKRALAQEAETPARQSPQPAHVAGAAASMSFRVGRGSSRRDDSPGHDDRGRSRRRDDGDSPMAEDGGEAADDDVEIEDDGTMDAMQAMMGFSGFQSTKGKKVAGNTAGGMHKAKKTEYRQYMNRVGGFNRPLSPSR